jgi:hypothetical protein
MIPKRDPWRSIYFFFVGVGIYFLINALVSCNGPHQERPERILSKYHYTEVQSKGLCKFTYRPKGSAVNWIFEDSCHFYHVGDTLPKTRQE